MVVRELITKLGFQIDTNALRRFDQRIGRSITKTRKLSQNLKHVGQRVTDLGRRLTFGLSAPLAAFSVFSLKATSDLERMNIAFATMLGSTEKAKAFTQTLLRFAEKTPFTIPGVMQAAKQLLAVGIAEKKVLPTLKALGDVSAGLSVDLFRVVKNFGQVRAIGRLMTRDLNDFTAAGIPIREVLAKNLKVTTAELTKMVRQSKVGFKDVEEAFLSMSGEGGKFDNLMIKLSSTLSGEFSNLIDSLFSFRAEFGKLLDESLGVKDFIIFLKKGFASITKWLKELSPLGRKFIGWMTLLAIVMPPLILTIGAIVVVIKTLIFVLGLLSPVVIGIVAALAVLSAVFAFIADDLFVWANDGKSAIGLLLGDFQSFKENVILIFEGLKKFFKGFFTVDLHSMTDGLKLIAQGVVDIFRNMAKSLEELFPEGTFVGDLLRGVHKAASFGLKGAKAGVSAFTNLLSSKEAVPAFQSPGSIAHDFTPRDKGGVFVNIDSSIMTTVPEGTSAEQKRFINEDVRSVVAEEFQRTITGTILANARTE